MSVTRRAVVFGVVLAACGSPARVAPDPLPDESPELVRLATGRGVLVEMPAEAYAAVLRVPDQRGAISVTATAADARAIERALTGLDRSGPPEQIARRVVRRISGSAEVLSWQLVRQVPE